LLANDHCFGCTTPSLDYPFNWKTVGAKKAKNQLLEMS